MIATSVTVRDLQPGDWPEVAAIYREGIRDGGNPENEASVALHLACGFRVVGTRERIGQRDGEWRDVLVLERRAP